MIRRRVQFLIYSILIHCAIISKIDGSCPDAWTKVLRINGDACRCSAPINPSVSSKLKTDNLSFICQDARLPAIFRILNDLPPTTASNLTFEELIITGNFIVKLLNRFFGRISSIQTLILDDNRMYDIEPDVFTVSKFSNRLIHLSLSSNKIQILEPNLLNPLVNLESLDLSFNRLVDLEHHTIGSLKKLTRLSLRGNHIKSVSRNALSGLPNLKHLDLGQNQLLELPHGIFDSLVELESLDLSNNKLSVVAQYAFGNMPPLVGPNAIPFGANSILQANGEPQRCTLCKLRALDLSYNNISTVSKQDFSPFRNLHILSLANTNLAHMDRDCFWNQRRTLNELSLENNGLTNIDALWQCTELSKLNLSSNNLVQIENLNFAFMQILDLSHNQLSDMPSDTFAYSMTLQNLNLRGNQLGDASPLRVLDTGAIRAIDLSDNPWQCTCSLLHFVTSLKSNPGHRDVTIINENRTSCLMPPPPNRNDTQLLKLLMSNKQHYQNGSVINLNELLNSKFVDTCRKMFESLKFIEKEIVGQIRSSSYVIQRGYSTSYLGVLLFNKWIVLFFVLFCILVFGFVCHVLRKRGKNWTKVENMKYDFEGPCCHLNSSTDTICSKRVEEKFDDDIRTLLPLSV